MAAERGRVRLGRVLDDEDDAAIAAIAAAALLLRGLPEVSIRLL